MAARGRQPGFRMGAEHRDKIKNSNILRNLIKFAEGADDCPIDAAQANVGLGLLRKVMPDLKAVEHMGEDGGPINIKVTIGGDP